MSRFGTYLATAKLARMHLAEAQIAHVKNDDRRAVSNLFCACSQFLIALNNLSSLLNNKDLPRRRKKGARP